MRRRQFLAGSAALAGVGAAGSAAAACGQPEIVPARPAVYLVPGYRPDLASFRGRRRRIRGAARPASGTL